MWTKKIKKKEGALLSGKITILLNKLSTNWFNYTLNVYLRFFSRKKEGPSDNPKRAKTPDPARSTDRSRTSHRPNTMSERVTPQIRVSQVNT